MENYIKDGATVRKEWYKKTSNACKTIRLSRKGQELQILRNARIAY